MKLYTYRAQDTNPYENLATEQYLLEHVPQGACILYLWQNRHTVVIGRNQNAWQECRTARLEADGGFLARRLSGGGAVFHDLGNLNFTFLVNKEDYSVEKQLSVIVEACRTLGIPAERSGRNDVLTGGRKFSGNAFYEHEGRCYHHGTLLVDVDMEAMGRYLSPSTAKLQAKGVTSVRSRVVNLRELVPGLTIDGLAAAMTAAFGKVYGGEVEPLAPDTLDRMEVEALTAHYASWEWRYGRKIPCTLTCAQRFPWGEVSLQLQVEEGIVQQAAVYSDAMDWTLAPALEGALTGRRFSQEDLAAGVQTLDLEVAVKEDLLTLLAQQDI